MPFNRNRLCNRFAYAKAVYTIHKQPPYFIPLVCTMLFSQFGLYLLIAFGPLNRDTLILMCQNLTL